MDIKLDLESGKYVVAVSGGVDSVVLLDLLSKQAALELVVAHFDHGIRADSAVDAEFVHGLAGSYGLDFFLKAGRLGPGASELASREARYKFLRDVLSKTGADYIAMAHHQDDVIETAIINMLRGTTARGLGALKSSAEIKRPLLSLEKSQLLAYAADNKLTWREDSTNQDQAYLRNYVRLQIVPKLGVPQKKQLIGLINDSKITTKAIDQLISGLAVYKNPKRRDFVLLPHSVACELMARWLRAASLRTDKKTINRLVVNLKTAKKNATITINKNSYFLIKNGLIDLVKK
jgi:tRNA(Ile)-lysidine synthetase-like protein